MRSILYQLIHPKWLLVLQVLSQSGGAQLVAFDQIDKAPEERARGITIATAHGTILPVYNEYFLVYVGIIWDMCTPKLKSNTLLGSPVSTRNL